MKKDDHNECLNCDTRDHSVFCELDPDEVTALNFSKKKLSFKRGQKIFEEGAYPHGLYCVTSGKIKLSQIGSDGKEQIIHLVKNGDVIGYNAVLTNDKFSCTATALEESTVCFIPAGVFTKMVEKNARLTFRILRLFSNDLKSAEKTVTHIAQKKVKERLAEGILLLKENYGFENDGSTINITITREELANIVGTARESVIRLLAELDRDQVIALNGKRIKILNPRKLQEIAGH